MDTYQYDQHLQRHNILPGIFESSPLRRRPAAGIGGHPSQRRTASDASVNAGRQDGIDLLGLFVEIQTVLKAHVNAK